MNKGEKNVWRKWENITYWYTIKLQRENWRVRMPTQFFKVIHRFPIIYALYQAFQGTISKFRKWGFQPQTSNLANMQHARVMGGSPKSG